MGTVTSRERPPQLRLYGSSRAKIAILRAGESRPMSTATIGRNIAANAAGRLCSIVSVYLFSPLYLRFLGIEAYGLVGFYSTLLAILALADFGLTATLTREAARLSASAGSHEELSDVVRTYESLYAGISSLLAIIVWTAAPIVARYWLRPKTVEPSEILAAVRLMGVAIAFQMPSGLYIGGLMGLQEQVRSNALQVGWGLLRAGGAVVVLWLLSPTIVAFAGWQLLSNALYCFAARLSLWRVLGFGHGRYTPKFRWHVLRQTAHYAAGMAGMAVVSTLLIQADRVVISKMTSLEMLGYYTLAGMPASALPVLASPIADAVFPHLVRLVSMRDRSAVRLYHDTSQLVACIVVPTGLTLALFARQVILVWTGSADVAQHAALVASLLAVGQLLQALTVVPYSFALAKGSPTLNLQIGVASLVVITPLLLLLVSRYGILGAGISWVAMNVFTLPVYMSLLHRRFLPGELWRWCVLGIGRPVLVALPCVMLGRYLLPHTSSRLAMLGIIAVVWCTGVLATSLASHELRTRLARKMTWRGPIASRSIES